MAEGFVGLDKQQIAEMGILTTTTYKAYPSVKKGCIPSIKFTVKVKVTTAYNEYTLLKEASIADLSLLDSQNTSSKHLMLVFALNTNVQAI